MERKTEWLFTALGAGIALGFAVALTIGAQADRAQTATPRPTEVLAEPRPASDPDRAGRRTPVVEAVERVAPSVVSITTEAVSQDWFGRPYGRPQEAGEGSGVVIDPSGVILTNAHVLEGASAITVTFADGRSEEASVIGIAHALDLAVLKIEPREGISAVALGRSSDLMLGEAVIAIGNPFGLGHTVTTGVISATERPLETNSRVYQSFIQTDASINPGNSGGPLLNIDGELVGINTAIRPDSEGIGFAIPVDRAMKVARDLVQTGAVQLPWLGVLLDDVLLPTESGRRTAPQVVRVLISSPEEGTSFQLGDVILSVSGRQVQGRADLNAFLSGLAPGTQTNAVVSRAGQRLEVPIREQTVAAEMPVQVLERQIGVELAQVAGPRGDAVLLDVVRRGGAAAQLGLRPGDRIVAVDGRRVGATTEVASAILQALRRHRPTVLLTVRRGRSQGRLEVSL